MVMRVNAHVDYLISVSIERRHQFMTLLLLVVVARRCCSSSVCLHHESVVSLSFRSDLILKVNASLSQNSDISFIPNHE
jgi:hypothetical protein